MRMSLKYTGTLLIAFVALGSVVATSVQAEEPLRWKFKVGEKLDYNMVQEMQMTASGHVSHQPLICSLKLTRFRGDPTVCVLGVHDAQEAPTLCAGVPAADGRAGSGRPVTWGAGK